jgi:serine/threonine-protein kinase RsbW
MKEPEKAYLEVKSDLDLLSEVLSWFDQFNRISLPKNVWLQCQLALAEGFTNAVRHAHKNMPKDTLIKLEVILQGDTLEIRIWDYGESFDLEKALKKLSATANLTSEGGRGIKLLYQLADTLDYAHHAGGQNCLTITKHFSPV